MRKIRVLLGVQPQLLAEVIRFMVEAQADMEVVGEEAERVALLLRARPMAIDVVVIAPLDSATEPAICRQLLLEHPLVRIVTLSGKGTEAYVYAAAVARQRIEESSEASILGAMRDGIRPAA